MAEDEPDEATDLFFSEYPDEKDVVEFAKSLVYGVKEREGELDRIIKSFLENWELERLAVVDHHILQIAIFELLYHRKAPPIVVIDEAIELAKRFSTQDSSRFVNGILDRIKSERLEDGG
jgi:N utilization substance protein B